MALESLDIPLENIISKKEVREKTSLETSPSEEEVREQIKLMLREKLQVMYSYMQESKKASNNMTASQTFESDAVIIPSIEESKEAFKEIDMGGSAFHMFDAPKSEAPTQSTATEDELEEFKRDAVVIPRAVASLNIAPQKAKLLSSSNENQTIVELSPKDEFEEGFVHVDEPTFVELCSTKYFDSILSGAKTLWAAKSHLPVVTSTALALYSNFSLITCAGVSLSVIAGLDYAINENCDRTKALLGAAVTISGLGIGAPIAQKLLVAGISSVGIFAVGASIFNPATFAGMVIGGASTFMLSKTGYCLTAASCLGLSTYLSSVLSTTDAQDFVKDAVRAAITDEIQGELGRQVENCNNQVVLGFIPVGKIFSPITNYLNNKACNKVESVVNNTITDRILNIGENGQTSALNYWKGNGDKFLNSLMFFPKCLVEFAPMALESCKNYYQKNFNSTVIGLGGSNAELMQR
ncbi:hypothetical protein I862_06370 [endosymbiont of Acanthamoeba sp. UWC8]|uniref:hypothetical protein n=1 Tax=endosymbiont of Acanthamoeba sp. UWC8 TaxID=86106 RepID=UPI0004D1599C|nr:hypothetical protein [endosymbiont of Acanthamoeba sp. UWC8]AIF81828.1 hypothetical protein I862_06370 [endosymbiont of Acanthamoeba sp. UWC8]